MERRNSTRSEVDVLNTFTELFNEILEDDMEVVDAELRAAGYDPEAAGRRLRAVAEQALGESPLNLRYQEPGDLSQASLRHDLTPPLSQAKRDMLCQHLDRLLGGLYRSHSVHRSASRCLMQYLSDENLLQFLSELEPQVTRAERSSGKAE